MLTFEDALYFRDSLASVEKGAYFQGVLTFEERLLLRSTYFRGGLLLRLYGLWPLVPGGTSCKEVTITSGIRIVFHCSLPGEMVRIATYLLALTSLQHGYCLFWCLLHSQKCHLCYRLDTSLLLTLY